MSREGQIPNDIWGQLLQLRDEQRRQREGAIQVVDYNDLPWELNRQGKMRWYLSPFINDTATKALMFYEQEIPPGSRSGRVHFQGGAVLYIVQGRGYTILDGVRYEWEADDVVQLPLRTHGITFQHFNLSSEEPARFVICEPNTAQTMGVDRGSGFEQLEDCPEYREAKSR